MIVQAAQTQVPQPFLIQEALHALYHLCHPPPGAPYRPSPTPSLCVAMTLTRPDGAAVPPCRQAALGAAVSRERPFISRQPRRCCADSRAPAAREGHGEWGLRAGIAGCRFLGAQRALRCRRLLMGARGA